MRKSVYTRPAKRKYAFRPGEVEVPNLDKIEIKDPVIVHAATECHVTPVAVADLLVCYLNPHREGSVLEPSAGTGNLIQALIDHGIPDEQITMVEKNHDLYNVCGDKFGWELGASYEADFLEWSRSHIEVGNTWDYVIMNPPFRKVKPHLLAAARLLSEHGELIAIVPQSFDEPGFTELERLPVDTFSTCKVFTKIVHYQN